MELRQQIASALPASVLAACQQMGAAAARHGEELFIVGGAVRDIILGRPFTEVDLTLAGDVERLAREAEAAGLARRTATSQFLTVKLSIDGHQVDVVTARRESYPRPGALPVIEPDGLEADLLRRDFTVNALAVTMSPERFGEVEDPHGGLADLAAGLLRGLHEATFRDDATRILRGARYAARLRFRLEEQTEEWLRRDTPYLKAISPDRLRHEMRRVFQEPEPERALDLLADWGALAQMGPGVKWDAHLAAGFARTRALRPPDVALERVSWAMLAFPLGRDGGEAMAAALNLPPTDVQAVREMFRWRRPFGPGGVFRETLAKAGPREVVERLDGYDPAAVTALAALDKDPRIAERLHRYMDEWRHSRPALSGDDLLDLGVPQGPLVGAYLKRLRLARLDGEAATADEERALARQWLAAEAAE